MPPPNAPVTVIFPPSIALPGPGARRLAQVADGLPEVELGARRHDRAVDLRGGTLDVAAVVVVDDALVPDAVRADDLHLRGERLGVRRGQLRVDGLDDGRDRRCRRACLAGPDLADDRGLRAGSIERSALAARAGGDDASADQLEARVLARSASTFLASFLRIGSRPDSSRTGVMLPSAAVENEISGARLVPAIVQVSLPWARTTSAAIRSAAAFAASAEAVATAGANDTSGTAIVIDAGVPSAASCWSSAAMQGRLVHGATVLRRGDAERPALAGRHGGVHGGLVDRRARGCRRRRPACRGRRRRRRRGSRRGSRPWVRR